MIATTNPYNIKQWVETIQYLSLARDQDSVIKIVKRAARELTGADGATFVLREDNVCYYADEDAIGPLWKGRRFPLDECISGWTMIHRKAAMIEDIFLDERIPHLTYKHTFVKSLLIVPIRTMSPIGAIGNYWAQKHRPSEQEIMMLQALADVTAVTLENIKVYAELGKKLIERSTLLNSIQEQNKQLEEFCYIISHNLRSPLNNLLVMADMITESSSIEEKTMLISKQKPIVSFLQETFEQLVEATQVRTDSSIEKESINVEEYFVKTLSSLQGEIIQTQASITFDFQEAPTIQYSAKYFSSILLNLISNSIKYRSTQRPLKIHVCTYVHTHWICLEVADNGLGIDLQKNKDKIFKLRKVFHNHPQAKGFGLFITKTQVEAMGGSIKAESQPDLGTKMTVMLCKNTL